MESLSVAIEVGKQLSKCSWYPKRKLGVTMHFSEIIKLQHEKSAIHCFVLHWFFESCCLISCKKCYLQFSFWIPIALAKTYFPRIVSQTAQKYFGISRTVLKSFYDVAKKIRAF